MHIILQKKAKQNPIHFFAGRYCPPITLKQATDLCDLNYYQVVPGQQICRECVISLENKLTINAEAASDDSQWSQMSQDSQMSQVSQLSQTSEEAAAVDPDLSRSNAQEKSHLLLGTLEVSPWKLHGVDKSQKPQVVANKVLQAHEKLRPIFAEAMNIDVHEVEKLKTEEANMANDTRILLESIKQQIQTARDYKDKIQLLTLIPNSWACQKAAEFFGVTEYMVKKAVSLRDSQGILAVPKIYSRTSVSPEVFDAVRSTYEDDEFSRLMPGQKDFINVDGIKTQKRLLLMKLEELFRTFKEKHPDLKIQLAKFCSLRPKWCVLVGGKGTHTVCTCIQHENAKLLASETDFDYKVFFK